MKYCSLILLLCLSLISLDQEFKTYENGLIYSPSTMQRLAVIVDSLNLKCKNRLLFWYLYQNMAHWQTPAGKTQEERKALYEQTERAISPVKQTLPAYLVKNLEKE